MLNKSIYKTFSILIVFLVILTSTPMFRKWLIEIFRSTPEFSGVKLNSNIKEIKLNNHIICEDPGRDILKGVDYNIINCKDKDYRTNIYGIETSSRYFLFLNENLAKITISSINYHNNENAFLNLISKIDSGYTRIKSKDTKEIWDLGKGNTLRVEESIFHHGINQDSKSNLKSMQGLNNCKSKNLLDCISTDEILEMANIDNIKNPTQSRFIKFTIETVNNPK